MCPYRICTFWANLELNGSLCNRIIFVSYLHHSFLSQHLTKLARAQQAHTSLVQMLQEEKAGPLSLIALIYSRAVSPFGPCDTRFSYNILVTLSRTRMSKLTKNVKRISSANATNLFQTAKFLTSGFWKISSIFSKSMHDTNIHNTSFKSSDYKNFDS